jgi:putative transposase
MYCKNSTHTHIYFNLYFRPELFIKMERTIDKFDNKYRISSSRLQNWDYGSEGMYFVTINTQNHEHYFGEIPNKVLQITEIGKIVELEWLKTPEIRPDMNLKLAEFVVMPNHFHGIIIIGMNKFNANVRKNNF